MYDHLIIDLELNNNESIKKKEDVEQVVERIINKSNLTAVKKTYHQFQPNGVTATIILSESHFCLHTWPEHNKVAIDLFCCDHSKVKACKQAILDEFNPTATKEHMIKRLS